MDQCIKDIKSNSFVKGIPAKKYENKDWPNFNNNLITKVVNVIKSGKINYTSVYMVKNLKRNFQILLETNIL